MQRWRRIASGRKRIGDLVAFHTRHKLLILSHNPNHYRFLGKLVAAAKQYPAGELFRVYEAGLLEALKHKTTVQKNTNVLQHLQPHPLALQLRNHV